MKESMLLLKPCLEAFSDQAQSLFQFTGAIAIAAGPGFCAIRVAALASGVGVFDLQQIKKFLAVRPFLLQGREAEADFDPRAHTILSYARFLHVLKIFVARDGPTAEALRFYGLKQRLLFARLYFGFDQVAHTFAMQLSASSAALPSFAVGNFFIGIAVVAPLVSSNPGKRSPFAREAHRLQPKAVHHDFLFSGL